MTMPMVDSQILKEDEELNRAFGSGPVLPKPKVTTNGEPEPKMTKIMIFGNANQCEVAQRMIQEAIDNKVGLAMLACRVVNICSFTADSVTDAALTPCKLTGGMQIAATLRATRL